MVASSRAWPGQTKAATGGWLILSFSKQMRS
jgi:hypothetical protein